MQYKVCLIVDNPLRDLEGIALIAWHLAKKNILCYVVPMYCQSFDILAIKPDIVLVNYIRPNNVPLLLRYKKDNIKIAVLDTEGSPGKDMHKFAKHVSQIKERNLIDLYCMWGIEQFQAFETKRVFQENILKITGCPRYDYCKTPYKKTLPKLAKQNYILINTAFPIPKPKCTKGTMSEENALLEVGHEKQFVKKFLNDIKVAHKKTIEIISRLCKQFPNQNFILRPHPFESSKPYEKLLINSNFEIKQTGTSLEWLNGCICLIHFNCSTAIEATMLNKKSISLEWLNTDTLKSLAPPINVSYVPKNEKQLYEILDQILLKKIIKSDKKFDHLKDLILQNRLNFNDGNSSLNVCNALIETINSENKQITFKNFLYLENFKQFIRELFGYKSYHKLRTFFKGTVSDKRRNNKNINFKDLQNILERLNKIENNEKKVIVNNDFGNSLYKKRLFSSNTYEVRL